ncbi:MAG: AMIN domain-containing protein [Nostoc sp. JL31]|uniref:AMIN domain-containing protein n=1 Tax=Nostoc sp. JL31 TaxID=2815395 RepID=UPI0025D08E99|nr:AMIN domain-containing protein [Nostoc sp. JL31]MBN3892558.1 AMIN domain-containing protein [Nostoc sp. JL31]
MKSWIFLHKQNSWLLPSLIGYIFNFAVSVPVAAQDNQKLTTQIPRLSELKFPASNIKGLLSQSPTPTNPPSVPRQSPQRGEPPQGAGSPYQGGKLGGEVTQVTGVKANPTDKGVEVILQTTQGEQLQITNRSAENNFIADIPNAQLRLPNGDAFTFRSEKPVAGITEITVTNLDANTIQVTVTGEAGLPTVELFDDNAGLVFGVVSAETAMQPPKEPTNETKPEEPTAQQDEPIELVVTGEQDGYRVPDTSSATRTDTPLRDIPQSIQVIPQQVIKDQQATRLTDVLKNAPGVVVGSRSPRDPLNIIKIRGFDAGTDTLLNGIQDRSIQSVGFG